MKRINREQGWGSEESLCETETKRRIFEKVRRSMIELEIESSEIGRPLFDWDGGCPTSKRMIREK